MKTDFIVLFLNPQKIFYNHQVISQKVYNISDKFLEELNVTEFVDDLTVEACTWFQM